MSGNRKLMLGIMSAAIIVVFGACSSEKIQFNFNPANNTQFTQIMKSEKTITYQTGQMQTDSTRAEVSVKLEKAENGFKMTTTPVSLVMYRDSQAIENQILTLLSNLIVNYDIDISGQLRSINGYDKFMEEIQNTMPPDMAKNISSIVNKDVMIANELNEWNGRIGRFAGKNIKLGDKWLDTIQFQLPTGEMLEYYTVTTFSEFVDCDGSSCIKINFEYNSEETKVAGMLGEHSEDSSIMDSLEAMKVQLPDLFGEGYRIIDPATMLIHDEFTNRTIRVMVMRQGAQPMMVTVYEEKKYDYAY